MSLSKRVTRCSNATSSERSPHLYKGALSVPGCLCRSPQTFRVSPLPPTPTLAWTFAKDKDLFSGSGVPVGSRCWRGCPDRPRYGHTPVAGLRGDPAHLSMVAGGLGAPGLRRKVFAAEPPRGCGNAGLGEQGRLTGGHLCTRCGCPGACLVGQGWGLRWRCECASWPVITFNMCHPRETQRPRRAPHRVDSELLACRPTRRRTSGPGAPGAPCRLEQAQKGGAALAWGSRVLPVTPPAPQPPLMSGPH